MTPGSSATTADGPAAVIERVFDAPRDLVWRAWVEPDQFMRWYGPEGVTMFACEIDLRVGGRHLFGLRMPDGGAYWTTGVYSEVSPPERFVTTDTMADEHGNVVAPSHYGMPGRHADGDGRDRLARRPRRRSGRGSRSRRPDGPTSRWRPARAAAGTRPSTS